MLNYHIHALLDLGRSHAHNKLEIYEICSRETLNYLNTHYADRSLGESNDACK
jgi:hypothetical protein